MAAWLGDPGMGKTALARRCLAEAPGLRVLPARAGQAEADLDFGLADQLFQAAGGVVEPVLSAGGNGTAASSFAVGARLLEVVGERLAAGAVAILVDDLQWADRRSVEALTFMLRRLSVDPVIAVVTYRGPAGRLDEAAQRLLGSVENRVRIPLGGLGPDEVASLAAVLTAGPIDGDAVRWLCQGGPAVRDLTANLKMARQGFNVLMGLRSYCYLALAQYLAGVWDDVLLTCEQGFSAATINLRRYELPQLHLAAACVPAGRGAAEEAERHARLAEEAAASMDYGQERLDAAMARALVCQACGDYLGMADALGYWQDDAALDGCSPTASCCGAPGTARTRSSACGGPATCIWRCAPRRSWPGPKRSWRRVIFPPTRPRRSSRYWR